MNKSDKIPSSEGKGLKSNKNGNLLCIKGSKENPSDKDSFHPNHVSEDVALEYLADLLVETFLEIKQRERCKPHHN